MASYGRSKLTTRLTGLQVAGPSRAALQAAMAQSRDRVARFAVAAVSPTRWWARITSVTGIAVLLSFSVAMLVAGLVVTWPRH